MTSDNQQPMSDDIEYPRMKSGKFIDHEDGTSTFVPDEPMSVDEIFATLKVKHRWSRPKPFTEDKQLHVIVGKKAAIAQINQLIHEAWTKGYHAGKDSE